VIQLRAGQQDGRRRPFHIQILRNAFAQQECGVAVRPSTRMKTASFDCTRFAMRPDAFEICDLRGSGCALWSGANNLAARDSTGTIARCFPCMVHHTPRGCGDRQSGGELWLTANPNCAPPDSRSIPVRPRCSTAAGSLACRARGSSGLTDGV
jgi:hypothetical protein